MKRFLFILAIVLWVTPAFGVNHYPCNHLTGGDPGALDAIESPGLGDVAYVTRDSSGYGASTWNFVYHDFGEPIDETPPYEIKPDTGANANYAWVLTGSSLTVPKRCTGNTTLTIGETRAGMVRMFAAGTITLPAAATVGYGTHICFSVKDAGETCVIEIDDADKIELHGTMLDAGDPISSPGNAGDFICLTATSYLDGSDQDGWFTTSYGHEGWTDAGTPIIFTVILSQSDCSTIVTKQICIDSDDGKIYYYDDNTTTVTLIGSLDLAPIASPTFTGTVTLPTTVTMPNAGKLKLVSTTDAHEFCIQAHNGTDFADIVCFVADSGGAPEMQLQPGAAFTGLGTLTIEDTGIIRNETDTSDDYFRIQATDEVGGTPAQIDVIRVTNAGEGGEISVKIGDGGGANYWLFDQSGDMSPAGTATLKIPNGAAPAPAATGQVAVDTTTDQFQYYGSAALKAISPKHTYSIVVPSVAATDDSMFVKLPYGITVTSLDCIVTAATSATINIVECNGTGTCSDEVATADLVCDTDGAVTTAFGGAAGAAADSGDWLQLKVESIADTPGTLTVTLTYSITAD